MKQHRLFPFLLILIIVCSSCHVTRHLKDGEYMLTKNVVKTDLKDPQFDDLYYYVRPTPNKKFIDIIPFKTWSYVAFQPKVIYTADGDSIVKDSKFRQKVRNKGEAPVLLDSSAIDYSVNQLKLAMLQRGYFNADVTTSLKFKKEKQHKVKVFYNVTANTAYYINKISYVIDIPEYKKIILLDTINRGLKIGNLYNEKELLAERERITKLIRNNGYFYVSNDIIHFVIDTLRTYYLPHKKGKTVDIEIHVDFSKISDPEIRDKYAYKFQFNDVYIYSNYQSGFDYNRENSDRIKYRRGKKDSTSYYIITEKNRIKKNGQYKPRKDFKYKILSDNILTKKGSSYTDDAVSRSYKKLNDLNNFNFINVDVSEVISMRDTLNKTGKLNTTYRLTRSKLHSLAAEIDLRSDKGNVSLTYSNKNLFRSAEFFNINVYGGADIQSRRNEAGKLKLVSENIDAGGELSIDFKRLLLFRRTQKIEAVSYGTAIKAGIHFQQAPLYQRWLFNAAITYRWSPNYKISHTLAPIDISVINITNEDPSFYEVLSRYSIAFQKKYQDNVLFSFKYTLHSTPTMRDSRNELRIQLKLESSGMFITGINALANKISGNDKEWSFFGLKYANFELAELDLRFKHKINKNNAVAMRFDLGVGVPMFNSGTLPFERSFFLGNANSMRAWEYRSLGPGSYYSEDRKERSGDIKIEANLEYRGPIYKFIKFGIFADAGNVWLTKKNEEMPNAEFNFTRFYKEIALGVGAGIRLDFNFFLIRFDVGMPIYDPNELEGERWIGQIKKMPTLKFAIGHAF